MACWAYAALRNSPKKDQVNLYIIGMTNLGASKIWGPCSVEHIEHVHRRGWIMVINGDATFFKGEAEGLH
jgi:hypothetical protein